MLHYLKYILLFLLTSPVLSQQKMVLNNLKTIPATDFWNFPSASYTFSEGLKVQIGNNGNGGTLLLQIESSDSSYYIGGTVYLFLDDGNVITCTDKNTKSVSGKMIQSYYVLTLSEINLLKKNKLTDIRFRIIGNATSFSSPTGFFTAQNKIRRFGLPDKSYETVTQIKHLFNEK